LPIYFHYTCELAQVGARSGIELIHACRNTLRPVILGRYPLNIRNRLLFALLIGLCTTLFFIPQGRADDSNIIPFIELTEEYNDNIFFSVQDTVSDLITTISPGIEFVRRTERLSAFFNGNLNQLLYLNETDLNATDVFFIGGVGYRQTPRLGLSSEAGYIKDSRPDRDVDVTGFVQGAEIRKRFYFDLRGSYETSENIFNNLNYRFESNNYEDPEFTDSVIHNLEFAHTWIASRWLENTVGRFNLGYTHFQFEEARTDTIGGTIGAEWSQSEKISFMLDLGARFVQSKIQVTELVLIPNPPFFQQVTRDETSATWGGIGQLTFVYRGEFSSTSVILLNDLGEAGGRGGTVLRTSLAVTHDQQILEKLSAYAAAGFNINRALAGETTLEDIDERAAYFRPSLQYELNEHWFFDLAYNVTWVQDRVDQEEAVRNKIFGQVRFQWPVWEK